MESIGKILQAARLEKKLTLEALQQKTKIQKKHLRAIEEDAFTELPSSYYARTFIKQYAAEVGVDSETLVNKFDNQKTLPSKPVTTAGGYRSTNGEVEPDKWHLKDSLPLLLLFLTALLIIGGIAYATFKNADDQTSKIESKESIQEDSVSLTTSFESDGSDQKDEESTDETEASQSNKEKLSLAYLGTEGYDSNFSLTGASKDIDLELTAVGDTCWVGIQVEGEYVHDEMLSEGKTLSYKLANKPTDFSVVVGDVSHLKLKMNGHEINYNPEKEEAIKKNAHFSVEYK